MRLLTEVLLLDSYPLQNELDDVSRDCTKTPKVSLFGEK